MTETVGSLYQTEEFGETAANMVAVQETEAAPLEPAVRLVEPAHLEENSKLPVTENKIAPKTISPQRGIPRLRPNGHYDGLPTATRRSSAEELLAPKNKALCFNPKIDPEIFFADKGSAREATAKKICQLCPIRAKCLDYALENREEFGVWGGMTPEERRRLLRQSKR